MIPPFSRLIPSWFLSGSETRLPLISVVILRADKNPSVRLAALEALKLHPLESAEEQVVMEIPEDVLQDLRWTAQHDPNRDVRLRTLEIFHQSFEDLPSSVRETFQILAETDSCKNVRDWAKWYLEYGFYS